MLYELFARHGTLFAHMREKDELVDWVHPPPMHSADLVVRIERNYHD